MPRTKLRRPIIIYAIKASTLRNLMIFDLAAGSGVYFTVKVLTGSLLFATAGSMAGTEAIKRLTQLGRKRIIPVPWR